MPKVYFRTADSKAFLKEIASQVNFDQTLELIKGRFGIQKNQIKLTYNGEIQTSNFKLSSEIPHHIVHIIDQSKAGDQQINVYLAISNGKGVRKIQNVKTNCKSTAKDLVNKLYETEQLKKETSSPQGTELYHDGVKIAEDETFLDRGIQNNANINVLLRDDFPDPSDIPTCATLLANTVNPLIMNMQMLPQYYSLFAQVQNLKNAGFFLDFQQKYEGNRVDVIYSDYQAYRFPSNPQNQPGKKCKQDSQGQQGLEDPQDEQ